MNVLNVEDIERELRRVGACALHDSVRQWMHSVARNAIINGRMTPKDKLQNFLEYTPDEPMLDAPAFRELQPWAVAAIHRGETLQWFDPIQVHRRPFWKMLEAITNWFNSWNHGDRRINRVSRINFDTAVNAAAMWDKDVSENLWHYVQDRPPVIYNSSDGYRWVRLITELHFEREDRLMHHCIYSQGTYYKQQANGSHAYLSLRDSANNPHVTLEIALSRKGPIAGAVQQCKGNRNTRPNAIYQPHITKLIEHMQWTIRGDGAYIDYTPAISAKLGRPQPA